MLRNKQKQCHHHIQNLLVFLEEFLENRAKQQPADIGKQHHEPVDDQRQSKHT